MTDSEKVTAYIAKHQQWAPQLEQLRAIFGKSELLEEVKWGAPSYSYNKKLVAGMAAFKNHYAIWFHQGVFLADPAGKLHNAQEGKTKALRQWKFSADDTIDVQMVLSYIQEATQNAKAGKQIKPKRNTSWTIPPLMQAVLDESTDLKTAYENLTPGKQKDYANYIGEAKREATQKSRMEKIIPMILEGKGLWDKYKNC